MVINKIVFTSPLSQCNSNNPKSVICSNVLSQGADTSGESGCSKYKEMYAKILKSLNIVKLYRGMSKLKVEINVSLPQLLSIVVSVVLNGEFERFGAIWWVLRWLLLYVMRRRQGWKAHF